MLLYKHIRRRLFRHNAPGTLVGLCLALVFGFNQFYTPIHLIAYEHTDGVRVSEHADSCGSACDASNTEDDDHEGEAHEAHPEQDHLFGFLAHGGAPVNVTFSLSPCGISFHEVPFLATSISWNVAQNRGPPSIA